MLNMKQDGKVIIVTMSDKVTASEVTLFYDIFSPVIQEADKLGLVIDMTGFDDITGDAIRRDIPLELGLLDQLGKIPRVAIVSDKEFISAALNAINPLVPMMEMKVFTPEQEDEAFKFASELTVKASDSKGAHLLARSTPEVLAFELDGYLDDIGMEEISKEMNMRLERGDKFSALARIKSFGGFDPAILTEGSFFKMKFGAIKALKKYAMVSDESWLRPMTGFAKMVTGIDIRLFPLAEEKAAWEWVNQ